MNIDNISQMREALEKAKRGFAEDVMPALVERVKHLEAENEQLRNALKAIAENAEIGEREADAAFARSALEGAAQ